MTWPLEQLFKSDPYQLKYDELEQLQTSIFSDLTALHYAKSSAYKRILDVLGHGSTNFKLTSQVPFLPAALFKELDLISISDENVSREMTSSGTSGQKVSKIYLDKETSNNQVKALSKIVSAEIGQQRLPLIIVDSKTTLKSKGSLSARGAGIAGFSMFGRDSIFALDSEMRLDLNLVDNFLKRHSGSALLIFGFTFMVWENLAKRLEVENRTLDLSNATLIHGGGWKKLADEGVSNPELKILLEKTTGVKRVHDYYGMVEQTGSIFMECQSGFLHSNLFNNVYIRNTHNFDLCELGTPGIIQVMSILPSSYPGHSILTEDLGTIFGVDDCPCGRNGKRFVVHGRIKHAELRGCSDTYASAV